jgi:hypothetical protein
MHDQARVYALINIVMITASLCGCQNDVLRNDPYSTIPQHLIEVVAREGKMATVRELFKNTCFYNEPIEDPNSIFLKRAGENPQNFALGRTMPSADTLYLDDTIYNEDEGGLFKTPLEMLEQLSKQIINEMIYDSGLVIPEGAGEIEVNVAV